MIRIKQASPTDKNTLPNSIDSGAAAQASDTRAAIGIYEKKISQDTNVQPSSTSPTSKDKERADKFEAPVKLLIGQTSKANAD